MSDQSCGHEFCPLNDLPELIREEQLVHEVHNLFLASQAKLYTNFEVELEVRYS